MPTPLQDYITRLAKEYKTGVTTEHSLRPALVELLSSLPELRRFRVINEPKRIACGAPDIVLLGKENTPVAYLETKDIGETDLCGVKQNKEQFDRYKQALDLIVFTDFLRFLLYQGGECLVELRLAEQENTRLVPLPDAEVRFAELVALLRDAQPEPVTSPKRLALVMAGKAQLLARAIRVVLEDPNSDAENERLLLEWMNTVLKSSVSSHEFADLYAQTLVYGLLAARYHDERGETFSRQKAATLIPKSNPFLRKLFQHIGVFDLDERIAWIVDDLVGIFGVTNVRSLLETSKAEHDPIMLFYEDFLATYDPAGRKARGVYYTPPHVVTFIVRAVDDLLQKEFGLKEGLADQSLTEDGKHRLQILDPSTGTGTFLVEVVRKIYSKFAGQTGVWNDYVKDHLLPRLHGYEILMAPYAMAHLNLEYIFGETGATHLGDARYGIYLTNTLEDALLDGNLFAPADQEAREVSLLKHTMQVMVMLGNPPYRRDSSNKGETIERLMKSYKANLEGERILRALSDDYIKFIRYAQEKIEQTGEGIVAFVTNNSFLDGNTHRTMRQELLRVFDEIYILNLHGSSRLKEKTPEGGKDENIFDIQTGVTINLFVKKHNRGTKQRATLRYAEQYGLREEKYETLNALRLDSPLWKELTPHAPNYFFVEKDLASAQTYEKGFSLVELFESYSVGAVGGRDKVAIHFDKEETKQMVRNIVSMETEALRTLCGCGEDSNTWKLQNAIDDIRRNKDNLTSITLSYRPYDNRSAVYTGSNAGIFLRSLYKKLGVLLHPANFALCATRFVKASDVYHHCFIAKSVLEKCFVSNGPCESTYAFPLYRLPAGQNYTPAELAAGKTRASQPIPLELNMRPEVLAKISSAVGEPVSGEELFDYVYGVLHDPEYRVKYFEFLKIGYPRIPYPRDLAEYRSFATRGARLRRLHLMDDSLDLPLVATFDIAGTNEVTTVRYEKMTTEAGQEQEGKVWINDTQYFNHVPRRVWDHYVGAYQPARFWLQKRVGRRLDSDDVRWYLRVCATIAAESCADAYAPNIHCTPK